MTAAAIASSTEVGILVANHPATARPLPKEVRTVTGGGFQSPTIAILAGEGSARLLRTERAKRILQIANLLPLHLANLGKLQRTRFLS
ncbi:hypothetical protein AVEN_86653-1 [Araneus ventricosus]|uniref:Uncharacterized protein n=1 Tax=Araneus ventricosus TaxID=182803 RepID=A0A4Y2RJZ0_ARAVE|nr:hypothetical protein AVEN_260794-1 [Araneus ventricosus]GBN76098.1 hypothetical protein AVEN_86653-1 [Araneus ventricosus]